MSAVFDELSRLRVLPVVTVADPERAQPLADALTEGGLAAVEITLRTAAALAAIRCLSDRPELLLGAGTVLTPAQANEAVSAGARFVVTPGFSAAVVRECQALGVPVLPGVATATEVQMALEAGLGTVKLFPAVPAGGVALLKALAGPFAGVRFVPTGGIGPGNLRDFLAQSSVLAVGGSWMADKAMIARGDFEEIRRLTAETVALAKGAQA